MAKITLPSLREQNFRLKKNSVTNDWYLESVKNPTIFNWWLGFETEDINIIIRLANEQLQIIDDYFAEKYPEVCIVKRFKNINDIIKIEKTIAG